MSRCRLVISWESSESILICSYDGCGISEVSYHRFSFSAIDQLLALEYTAQQQTDNDEDNGDFDERETGLLCSHVNDTDCGYCLYIFLSNYDAIRKTENIANSWR